MLGRIAHHDGKAWVVSMGGLVLYTTLSGKKVLQFRSSAARSAPLHGLVRTTNIPIFIAKTCRDSDTDGPIDLKRFETKFCILLSSTAASPEMLSVLHFCLTVAK